MGTFFRWPWQRDVGRCGAMVRLDKAHRRRLLFITLGPAARRCLRRARWTIEGHALCTRHAAAALRCPRRIYPETYADMAATERDERVARRMAANGQTPPPENEGRFP